MPSTGSPIMPMNGMILPWIPKKEYMNHPLRKSIFHNQTYYKIVLLALALLIALNIYNFSMTMNLLELLPMVIQLPILMLVYTKHRYAKTALELWGVLIAMGAAASIFGKLLSIFTGDYGVIDAILYKLLLLIGGIALYHYANKTVDVRIID